MIQSRTCPDASRWQALLADSDAGDSAELEAHLAGCSRCQRLLDDLAVGSSGWLRDAGRLAAKSEVDPEVTKTLHRLREGFDDGHIDPTVALDFLKPSDQPGVLGTLGRYQVLEVLGRGAFGIVLKALDPDLLRPVAIKVLAPYLAPSGTARQRFLREARAAAAVSHDHIVTIHAVETGDNLPYIVMEYVTGISLQQRLDRDGPLMPAEIARIGLQTANGLAAAHSQGLVHRDIKPANILLENGVERVKITDFGLARAADDARLTQSGVAAGTPLYMSPEQARGEAVDQRSDLFSLGSVLYTLATGFPPFRADSTMGVLNRITNYPPRPIRETIPDFPVALEKIIMQLLDKEPGKRFQLAADVSFKLTAFLSGAPSESEPTSPAESESAHEEPEKPTRWWVTALCLMAAAMVVIVLTFKTPKGTLIVEVNDPNIKVALDGEELKITGAGPQEVRLKPGDYHVTATKDGKPAKVSQEVVTITKDGKQVVKVTAAADPVSAAPSAGLLLQNRILEAFPKIDGDRRALMIIAFVEAIGDVSPTRSKDGRWNQDHPSYPKLQQLVVEASKRDIRPERLRTVLKEAYELAGKIHLDWAAGVEAASRGKAKNNNPLAMDPTWGPKLDTLMERFMSLKTRLADTSAGTPFLTPGPIKDLDKAIAGVKESDREKAKRLLALRDQFALAIPRAQASAVRLHDLKGKLAGTERSVLEQGLEATYTALSNELNEMEKIAKDLGAKPALPVAVDSGHPAGSWEARQNKIIKEFESLIGAIAKTRTGAVVLTAGPMADPDKVTAGMAARDANRVKRLLAIRDQFGLLVPKAQKELDRWEKAALNFSTVDAHHKAGVAANSEWEQAKLEVKQAERALQTNEDALKALLADLQKVGSELGVSAGAAPDALEAEYKKLMAEYDGLALRLAPTVVGRLLATFPPDGSGPSSAIRSAVGDDAKKIAQGERLLSLRGEFIKQGQKAENALVAERETIATQKRELNSQLDDLIRQNGTEARFRMAAMGGILEDLKKLADEIDPPAKKEAGPGKGPGH